MGTFVYSPGIQVIIDTRKGTLDVSDDISSCTVDLAQGHGHTANIGLVNYRRKYDGVFTPNDRVIIRMKRLRLVQVFAGYINTAPFFSAYPDSITLTCEDTLKRLRYTLWDAGAPESVELMRRGLVGSVIDEQQLANKAKDLLVEVGGWPEKKIHIGRVPSEWMETVNDIYKSISPQFSAPSKPGTESVIAGQFVPLLTQIPGDGNGTGIIPASSGNAVIGSTEDGPVGKWEATMRFPYASEDADGTLLMPPPGLTRAESIAAKSWWLKKAPEGGGQRILVRNPKSDKMIVVKSVGFLDFPGAAVGLSGDALKALGFDKALIGQPGARFPVTIGFAPLKTSTVEGDASHALDAAIVDTRETLGLVKAPDSTAVSQEHTAAQQAATESLQQAQADAAAAQEQLAGGDQPVTTTGSPTPTGADAQGLDFTERQILPQDKPVKGHVAAAADFIVRNFEQVEISSSNGGRHSAKGDHYKGLAIDVAFTGPGAKGSGEAYGKQKEVLNSVAMFLSQNPNMFNVKSIIWFSRQANASGWRDFVPSAGASGDAEHVRHVHISFNSENTGQVGPSGGGWAGSSPAEFATQFGDTSATPAPVASASSFGQSAFGTSISQFLRTPVQESIMLAGPRLLMNDDGLQPTIEQLLASSLRTFTSAPNGDFIAWFPDYFGLYGMAGVMEVQTIELQAFSMGWNDERLKTHVFKYGNVLSAGTSDISGSENELAGKLLTHGIASIDFPELMQALMGVQPNDPLWSREPLLRRFGARVNSGEQYMNIATTHEAEFWAACFEFMRNWSSQFSASIPLTFMPELFPGMILRIPEYHIQFYVQGVSHNINMANGGGFDTTVSVIAPSDPDGGGLHGLVRAGTKYDNFNPIQFALSAFEALF